MPLSFRRAALAQWVMPLGFCLALTVSASAQDAAPAADLPDPDKVVATVAGQPVTEADMALALASVDQQYAQLPTDQRRAAAFMAVMEIKLMAARAIAQGLDKDPEFERRMNFLRDRALHSEVIEKDVAANVTDDEVRARYDKQISETPPVNEVKARHILVETEEEARELVRKLDEGGEFETLANENTKDPSGKTSGGDLGYFGPNQMVPEFEKAAFALEVGAYTKEPVQSQFGWHIIKVEDKRAQQPPAFDAVKDQIRNLVFRDKYFELVEQLRKDGDIDITDADLKTAVEAMDAARP